jgi:hypothetical protein
MSSICHLQAISPIEDVSFVEVVEDSLKFFGAELGFIMFSSWIFSGWRGGVCGVADGDRFYSKPRQAVD